MVAHCFCGFILVLIESPYYFLHMNSSLSIDKYFLHEVNYITYKIKLVGRESDSVATMAEAIPTKDQFVYFFFE